jgi:REP element-mobilizing transposase RayT
LRVRTIDGLAIRFATKADGLAIRPTGKKIVTVETWNLAGPPGFQGLRIDVPVTVYYRHLPHWRQDGATYFVTFRLADSLPQSKLNELKSLKREFAASHGICGTDWQSVLRKHGESIPREAWEAFCHEQMRRMEQWLDQGMGSCQLKRSDIANIVVDVMHHFDGEQYELGCYVVMPNHVHAVMRPLKPTTNPLETILQSRKLRTSREINSRLGQTGTLWQEESFDRIIRDEEHLYRCLQYIGDNPTKGGLSLDQCPRWVRPSWEELGWKFEETT